MAILPILNVPDPRLKTIAIPIEAVDTPIKKLMQDMLETMYDDDGVGLAATQLGIPKRLIVIDFKDATTPKPLCIANPEIIWASSEKRFFQEGCLSVPDQWADIERHAEVKVRYLNELGESQELHAKDILSSCIQHEIDHLNGILFIDHLSKLKRQLMVQRSLKTKKSKKGQR
jgi:peptide deformylase